MFGQLTIDHFMTPVFRTLFQAIAAAGGLPSDDTPQGLWMHNLTKQAGQCSTGDQRAGCHASASAWRRQCNGAQPVQANVSGGGVGVNGGAAAVQLRPATPEEQRYATELLTRLLDMGFMRQIGLAKRRMAQLPDGEEKITLLGQITRMETARKDLQAQIYGNTVG